MVETRGWKQVIGLMLIAKLWGQNKMEQATKSLNRTQVGVIILLVGYLFSIGGVGMVATGQFSSGFVRNCCTNFVPGFLGLIGIIILYTDSRHYGDTYRTVYGIVLALYISAILSAIVGLIGGGPFTKTGNLDNYRLMMHSISITTGLLALVPSVAAWHLFKPGWRLLPIIIGVYRAVMRVAIIQNMLRNTTLVAQLSMEVIIQILMLME